VYKRRQRRVKAFHLLVALFPVWPERLEAADLFATLLPMDLHLQDRVILVTGGAKGIGAAICRVLAAEGAVPVVIGRNCADNERLVAEIAGSGGRANAVQAELTQTAECRRAVEEALATCGRIDGLVNNAGINDGVNLEHGSTERFLASLRNNLVHYYEMAHFALPELKRCGGAVVNIGSKVGETGQGGTSAYAAANGGRNALTREWACELAQYNIRVNAVIVAECWTPMYETWLSSQPDPTSARAAIERRIPLGRRMTTGEEIAQMVAFLLSDRSSHTTGQLIHVDGGYVHLDRGLL
jgi:L-fucose dehydrogenase